MTDIQAIHIEFIDHNAQRVGECGDYWVENNVLQIRVSRMGNTAYQVIVAIHELVEWMLTDMRGLTEKEIMDFDTKHYESESSEAGFSAYSPYLKEHTLATSIEMMLCAFAGIPWDKYTQTVNEL